MSTQAIQAGEAFIQLNIKGDEFQKSLNRIGDSLDAFGTQTTSLLSTLKGAFAGSIAECGQFGDAISLTGMSITGIGVTLGVFDNLRQHLHVISILNQESTFTELQKIAALRMSLKIQSDHVVVQKAIGAVSYLSAIGIKVLAGAQWVLNTAFLACPIGWLVAGLAGIGAAIGGVMYLVGAFGDSTAETAKSMEELRKRNDEFRNSARESVGILEDLSRKTSLNASQQDLASKAFSALNHSCDSLGGEFTKLNVVFDKSTGKMGDISQQLLKLKEEMRLQEAKDLGQEFDALTKHLEFLKSCLNEDGEVGWRRWFGTWFFGYMDNAEEIQQKIQETQQKIQENVNQQAIVVDWSVEYKENEKKLEEIYAKEKEAAKNALAVKLDAIHQEMEERRALLKMLIAEASARSDLSEEEMKKLKERQAALAALDAEEKKRVADAKADDDAQAQKIETDFFAKRAENEENIKWKRDLEADPDASLKTASSSSEAADTAFRNAVTALKNADETTSNEELERLKAEVEKTRKEAEKWYARREEAAAKVAEHEKKIAEEAQKAADEAREKAKADAEAAEALKDSRLDEIKNLKESKEEERARENEQKEWDSLRELDSARAEEKAKTEHDRLTSGINAEYAELENLAKNGASDEVYQAQLKKVQDMEREIDLWADRLEDISLGQMEEVQENTESANQSIEKIAGPDLLTRGSVDAQRKFLELQKNQKDPAIAQREETNNLLKRGLVCWENIDGQIGLV